MTYDIILYVMSMPGATLRIPSLRAVVVQCRVQKQDGNTQIVFRHIPAAETRPPGGNSRLLLRAWKQLELPVRQLGHPSSFPWILESHET